MGILFWYFPFIVLSAACDLGMPFATSPPRQNADAAEVDATPDPSDVAPV
jgi:hypothetical protein